MPRSPQQQLVDLLRDQLRSTEGLDSSSCDVVSCGCADVDRLLPGQGFRRGALIEWITATPAAGAATLALIAAREASRGGGALVVIERSQQFYAPAAAALGSDLANTIVIQPQHQRDEHWAIDQSLRSRGVAAVWAHVDRLDNRTLRRWQLAAETSGCLGCFVRPPEVRGQPSWAEVQLWIAPAPAAQHRKIRVTVLRCRGGTGGASVLLSMDEITGTLQACETNESSVVHLAPELAYPTPGVRAARA